MLTEAPVHSTSETSRNDASSKKMKHNAPDGVGYEGGTARYLLHSMFNAYWEPLTFELPPVPAESQQHWRRCIDTALASPDDIYPWDKGPLVEQATYVVQPRSVVLLALALDAAAEDASQAR